MVKKSKKRRERMRKGQCARKLFYNSQEDAESTLVKLKAKNLLIGKEGVNKLLHIYECPWCEKLHIGRRHWVRGSSMESRAGE